jgi:nicotinamidase-related amidase
MVMADPYPWPYDGPVEPGRLALVIAGAQRGWQRRSVVPTGMAVTIQRVAERVRQVGGLVVHVRHAAAGGEGGGLPPARSGPDWALVTEVDALDLVVDAVGVDGFSGSPLDAELRRRHLDTLVLAGYGAEAAVSSTLRSANDRGYECLTLRDATAPFEPVTGRRSLHSITMSGGIFGAVASSDALLAALSPVPELTTAEALR